MSGEKIGQALKGAEEFVEVMDPKDWLMWLPFDDQLYSSTQGLNSVIGEQLQFDIRSTTAHGGTALYDAIAHAYQELEERRKTRGDTVRYGLVVLSDGKDTSSKTNLPELEAMLRPSEEDPTGIQIHTIGIGKDADEKVLIKIAKSAHGKYWEAKDSDDITAIYRQIAAYW